MDSQEFLAMLDSEVWIEKRLFIERLMVLDDISGADLGGALIFDVLKELGHPPTSSVTAAAYDAITIAARMGLGGTNSNSAGQQFLCDLWVYGLREALGYLHEYPAFTVGPKLRERLQRGYAKIGALFLQHEDGVRQQLERYARGLQDPLLPRAGLYRVVAARLAEGSVWEDGLPQSNLA